MYNSGDTVQLKKAHACGGDIFVIVRTGADYKLKCSKCGHVIMLDSVGAKKAVKKVQNTAGERSF